MLTRLNLEMTEPDQRKSADLIPVLVVQNQFEALVIQGLSEQVLLGRCLLLLVLREHLTSTSVVALLPHASY